MTTEDTTNNDEKTVTGDVVADPIITDHSDVGVLFTYVDLYDGLSHSTLFQANGRYRVVRIPEADESPDHPNTTDVTGNVVNEALVDETEHTGFEVTHLDFGIGDSDSRQFTDPGVYKVVHITKEND